MPFDELLQIEREMLADVSDVIHDDVPSRESPFAVRALELVAVAAGRDRLEW